MKFDRWTCPRCYHSFVLDPPIDDDDPSYTDRLFRVKMSYDKHCAAIKRDKKR